MLIPGSQKEPVWVTLTWRKSCKEWKPFSNSDSGSGVQGQVCKLWKLKIDDNRVKIDKLRKASSEMKGKLCDQCYKLRID